MERVNNDNNDMAPAVHLMGPDGQTDVFSGSFLGSTVNSARQGLSLIDGKMMG